MIHVAAEFPYRKGGLIPLLCSENCRLVRRLLARNRHGPMSDLSPLSGVERKLDFGAVRSVFDPTETLAVPNGLCPKPGSAPIKGTRLIR